MNRISSQPMMKPTATPPSASSAKRTTAPSKLNAPVSAAATAKRNSTRPAASLSRLSPSSSTISRRGSATRSSTALAATASGGETIAPSVKQAAHGSAGTAQCTATPTASVVNTTAPIASSMMPPRLRLNSSQTEKYAPSTSSGGRNTISTRSGSRLTGGRPGTNAMPAPPTSSAAAGGSRSFLATSSSTTIAANDSRTSLKTDTADTGTPSRG